MTEEVIFDHDEAEDAVAAKPSRPGLPKLTQSSRNTCVPTAFAMVLSRRDPEVAVLILGQLLHALGRDDDRGYHVQELLSLAMDYGTWFMPFDANPDMERAPCWDCGGDREVRKQVSIDGDSDLFPCNRCDGSGQESLPPMKLKPLNEVMEQCDGVLVGQRKGTSHFHAVAWCSKTQKCLDPEEGVYDIERFEIDTFWAASPTEV